MEDITKLDSKYIALASAICFIIMAVEQFFICNNGGSMLVIIDMMMYVVFAVLLLTQAVRALRTAIAAWVVFYCIYVLYFYDSIIYSSDGFSMGGILQIIVSLAARGAVIFMLAAAFPKEQMVPANEEKVSQKAYRIINNIWFIGGGLMFATDIITLMSTGAFSFTCILRGVAFLLLGLWLKSYCSDRTEDNAELEDNAEQAADSGEQNNDI